MRAAAPLPHSDKRHGPGRVQRLHTFSSAGGRWWAPTLDSLLDLSSHAVNHRPSGGAGSGQMSHGAGALSQTQARRPQHLVKQPSRTPAGGRRASSERQADCARSCSTRRRPRCRGRPVRRCLWSAAHAAAARADGAATLRIRRSRSCGSSRCRPAAEQTSRCYLPTPLSEFPGCAGPRTPTGRGTVALALRSSSRPPRRSGRSAAASKRARTRASRGTPAAGNAGRPRPRPTSPRQVRCRRLFGAARRVLPGADSASSSRPPSPVPYHSNHVRARARGAVLACSAQTHVARATVPSNRRAGT